jgi:quercetin dioxygenase-like cupin family protein
MGTIRGCTVSVFVMLAVAGCQRDSLAPAWLMPLSPNVDTLNAQITPGVTLSLIGLRETYTLDDTIAATLVLKNNSDPSPFILWTPNLPPNRVLVYLLGSPDFIYRKELTMADKGRVGAKERALDAAFLSFTIDEQVNHLKQEKSWQSGDRNAVTLVKNPSVRVTLLALRRGASLREHHVEGPITIFIVEGSIDFIVGQDKCALKRGGFLTLERTVPHDVEALEDSVILLTIIQPK